MNTFVSFFLICDARDSNERTNGEKDQGVSHCARQHGSKSISPTSSFDKKRRIQRERERMPSDWRVSLMIQRTMQHTYALGEHPVDSDLALESRVTSELLAETQLVVDQLVFEPPRINKQKVNPNNMAEESGVSLPPSNNCQTREVCPAMTIN